MTRAGMFNFAAHSVQRKLCTSVSHIYRGLKKRLKKVMHKRMYFINSATITLRQ